MPDRSVRRRSAGMRLAWSAPASVDHRAPFGDPYPLWDVACPSASLCVGGGGSGAIEWTSDPAAGGSSWRAAVIDDTSGVDGTSTIDAVSCPTVTFCVAVDDSGYVLVSHDPAGGAGAWARSRIPRVTRLVALSCPSVRLCVAVDGQGAVASSSDPAGGARAWKVVSGSADLDAIACPSVSVCVATGPFDGGIVASVSSDPTGGARAWRSEQLPIPRPYGFGASSSQSVVACLSASLCVAGIGQYLLSSELPLGGASGWKPSYKLSFPLDSFAGLSCVRSAYCVAVSSTGVALSTLNPAAGPASWASARLGHQLAAEGPDGLACTARPLCVAVQGQTVTTAARAATGGVAWTASALRAGSNAFTQLACPSTVLCVATDDAGNIATTRRPAAGPGSWSIAHVDSARLVSLSCPSASLCIASDASGKILSSTNPAGGHAAWRATQVTTPSPQDPQYVADVTCPSTSVCIGVIGATGEIALSTDPATGTWRIEPIDSSAVACGDHDSQTCPGMVIAISCPSAALCVAIDSNGNALTSTEPAAQVDAWHSTVIEAPIYGEDNQLQLLSCPSVSVCVVTDTVGNVISSTAPSSGRWKLLAVDPYANPNGVSFLDNLACPTRRLCVGLQDGEVITSTNPTASNTSAWKSFTVGLTVNAGDEHLSCNAGGLCEAFNASGQIATSSSPSDGAKAWSTRRVFTDAVEAVTCPSRQLCVALDQSGKVSTQTG